MTRRKTKLRVVVNITSAKHEKYGKVAKSTKSVTKKPKLVHGKLSLRDFQDASLQVLSRPSREMCIKVMKHYRSEWKKHAKDTKDGQHQPYFGLDVLSFVSHGSSGFILQCKDNKVLKLPRDVSPECKKHVNKDLKIFDVLPTLSSCKSIVTPHSEQCPFGSYVMDSWQVSLAAWLQNTTSTIDAQQLMVIIDGVCTGISQLARNRYLHNDIKPQNILLNLDATTHRVVDASVCDLGSVRFCNSSTTSSTAPITTPINLSQGTTIGYRSPELVMDTPLVDTASDLFSFALVVMECVFGRVIPISHNTPNVFDKIMEELKGLERVITCDVGDVIEFQNYVTQPLYKTFVENLLNIKCTSTSSCFWKREEAYNNLDADLMQLLKQCVRLIPQHRLCFGSITGVKKAFASILSETGPYVWVAPPGVGFSLDSLLSCPWTTLVKNTHMRVKTGHPCLLWFVVLLWTRAPCSTRLVGSWMRRKFITKRAKAFQLAAQLMWKGNGEWVSAVKSACLEHNRRWPKSMEEFYVDYLKLPLVLLEGGAGKGIKTVYPLDPEIPANLTAFPSCFICLDKLDVHTPNTEESLKVWLNSEGEIVELFTDDGGGGGGGGSPSTRMSLRHYIYDKERVECVSMKFYYFSKPSPSQQ